MYETETRMNSKDPSRRMQGTVLAPYQRIIFIVHLQKTKEFRFHIMLTYKTH
jgi:hypothetical protein